MKPLGIRSGIVYIGTRVIQKANSKPYTMPETYHTTLLASRSGLYEFVYKGTSYLVHPDNVTFK